MDPNIKERRKDARRLYTLTAWLILITIGAFSFALIGIGQAGNGEPPGAMASVGVALFFFAWAPFLGVMMYGRYVAARQNPVPPPPTAEALYESAQYQAALEAARAELAHIEARAETDRSGGRP